MERECDERRKKKRGGWLDVRRPCFVDWRSKTGPPAVGAGSLRRANQLIRDHNIILHYNTTFVCASIPILYILSRDAHGFL